MELSQSIRKTIKSLHRSQGRRLNGLFMAQGVKCVQDTIEHFELQWLLATQTWIEQHPIVASSYNEKLMKVTMRDLDSLSTLDSTPPVIAVYKIPKEADTMPDAAANLVLALDGIQDPGNLGTILRLANWMGIRHIIAGEGTVDLYNPKVVQATMGSISRVSVHYVCLPDTLEIYRRENIPVYGTFLEGENIYKSALTSAGVIIMGNEGHGISDKVKKQVSHKLYIPPFPDDSIPAESLNVSIATAIVVSQFRMREFIP